MKIRVLLFGPQARLVGSRDAEVEINEQASAGDLLDELGRQHPRLAPSIASSRLAINHEFATDDREIRRDDELALIGMVSGG